MEAIITESYHDGPPHVAPIDTHERPTESARLTADRPEIRRTLHLLCAPGDLHELRVLHVPAPTPTEPKREITRFGYFTDREQFADAAAAEDAPGIYFTLNPCDPALLKRADHRVRTAGKCTQDPDIIRRGWLLIDADPQRKAGVSATVQEKATAAAVAQGVRAWLTSNGFPAPIFADSGNGFHLLYRLDLENTTEIRDLVKRFLKVLAVQFDTKGVTPVTLDRSVYNASRICKLYGTVARKGPDTPDRPHRLSRLIDVPETLTVVSRELLEAVAGPSSPPTAPAPAPVRRAAPRRTSSKRGKRSREELKAELLCRALEQSPDGRNNGGLWLGCQLRDNDFSPEETFAGMLEYRDRCDQSGGEYTVAAVRATHAQVFGRPSREPWSESQTVTLPPRASGADLADAPDPEQLKAAAAELENDIGNGKRFARFHAADVRHTPELGWLVWDGRRWIPDEVAVAEAAKATALRIFHECPHVAQSGGADAGSRRGKWAKASGDRNRLVGMRKCAETDPTIAARREAFDTDLWLLNCLNGTVDLRTGTLRPPRREDLITRMCPVEFDPAARCEPWERFLAETTGGDRDLADFLALAVGSSLTGWADDEVYFFVHGPTNSGKGTFVEAIRTILGEYGAAADFETFLLRKDLGAPRPDLVKLVGKRFVVAQESEEGSTLAAARLKTMTGRDPQVVRDLYKPPFTFIPQWSIWLVANYRPKAPADDDAFWRRVVEVPFSHTVPLEQRDKTVKTRLTDPALAGPAILAWAVRGCLAWQANGLRIPEVVTRATTAYRESQDLVGRFLNDCCELHPHSWTSSGALKTAFAAWARGNLERTLSAKALATRFQHHGLEMKQAGVARTRGFAGVELVETEGLTLFGPTKEPENGGSEHMNGCTADFRIVQGIISHEGTLPESDVHPFMCSQTPPEEDLIEDFA